MRRALRAPALALLTLAAGCSGGDPEALVLADYAYPETTPGACSPGSRDGAAGRTDDVEFGDGFRVNVRTPRNYRAGFQHPLLVVYPAAGQSARASESFVGITAAATRRGYVVAFAASRRMTERNVRTLATLPALLSARWCIDPARVHAVGHSDGATTAIASLLLPGIDARPAAVAASAAGFARDDLADMGCPVPRPVMLIQKRDDAHFPGYVRELADWLARCHGCDAALRVSGEDCAAYADCPAHARTVFCELPGGHARWPSINDRVLDFLLGGASGDALHSSP
ncbi:MAG: hypothetical protein ACU85V_09610 [Gammaproteobacteria bacterium]